jgi:hypothetical protein
MGALICTIKELPTFQVKAVQIASWLLSLVFILRRLPYISGDFAREVFYGVYAFGFISMIHSLNLRPKPTYSTLWFIQFAVLATYLICISGDTYSTGCGFFIYSILVWFVISKDTNTRASQTFQLQVFADLCITFGSFIFLMRAHTLDDLQSVPTRDDWCLLGGGLVLVGILLKSIPGHKCAASVAHVVVYQGIFANTWFLFTRILPYYVEHSYYRPTLIIASGVGLVVLNIASTLTRNIYTIVQLLNWGVGCLVIFLGCLFGAELSQHTILAYLFIHGSVCLVVENIVNVMSGEFDITKMGGILKLTPVTFALCGVAFIVSVVTLILSLVCVPIINIWIHYDSAYAIVLHIFFAITYVFSFVRLIRIVFLGRNHSTEQVFAHVKELSLKLHLPVFLALVCGTVRGIVHISMDSLRMKQSYVTVTLSQEKIIFGLGLCAATALGALLCVECMRYLFGRAARVSAARSSAARASATRVSFLQNRNRADRAALEPPSTHLYKLQLYIAVRKVEWLYRNIATYLIERLYSDDTERLILFTLGVVIASMLAINITS